MSSSRSLIAVAFACLVVTSPRVARADDLPSPDALLARVRAAAGSKPIAFREVDEGTSSGAPLRIDLVQSGRDRRVSVDYGPFHSAYGSYRGQSWSQNDNGETILGKPESRDGDVVDEAIDDPADSKGDRRKTVTRDASIENDYVLADLDASGYGSKRFVDPATLHVVRRDDVRSSGTITTRYDDFRTVAGYTQSYHEVVSDGRPEDVRDLRISSFAAGPVADTDLTIPPDKTFVEFPAGKTTVTLPAHEARLKFVVRVTIAGRGYDFMLDSGASGIVLDEGAAHALHITPLVRYTNAANAGRFRSTRAILPEMHVGELTMHDVAVDTVPSLGGDDELGDFKVVGLLGFDFIRGAALKLDYKNGIVTATRPDRFIPPLDARAFPMDIDLEDGVPVVPVTVNGATGDRFLLDTGAYGAMIIFERFVRRNPAAVVDEGSGTLREISLEGVGGGLRTAPFQLRDVRFGPVLVHDLLSYAIKDRGAYDDGSDGLVGSQFLQLFDLYFDYRHAKAYFVYTG